MTVIAEDELNTALFETVESLTSELDAAYATIDELRHGHDSGRNETVLLRVFSTLTHLLEDETERDYGPLTEWYRDAIVALSKLVGSGLGL